MNFMRETNKNSVDEDKRNNIYERESVEVKLNLSKDTLELLEKVAAKRDLSVTLLLKLFVSKGLRELEPELVTEFAVKRFKSRKGTAETEKIDLAA